MEDLSSPMGAFVREHCVVGAHLSAPVQELFSRWKTWCEEKGWKSAGIEQTFGRDLRAVLPSIDLVQPRDPNDNGRRIRTYMGVRLKTLDEYGEQTAVGPK
jgi:putative DNA primase/helicase